MAVTKLSLPNVRFEMFFDRADVLNRLDKKKRSALNYVGGSGRQTIQRSMRKGGKSGITSKPGEPPRAQLGTLRKLTLYGYDDRSESVVIGPLPFARKHGGGNVPLKLEYGGRVTGLLRFKRRKPIKNKRGQVSKYYFRKRTYSLRPRPFIGEKSVNYPIIMAKFRDIIRDRGLL